MTDIIDTSGTVVHSVAERPARRPGRGLRPAAQKSGDA